MTGEFGTARIGPHLRVGLFGGGRDFVHGGRGDLRPVGQHLGRRGDLLDRGADLLHLRADLVEGGIQPGIGAVEGFDVRFEKGQLERMSKFLAERYGKPAAEKSSALGTTVEWKANGERARLSAEQGRRRASLLVWRGAFETEIYKVR